MAPYFLRAALIGFTALTAVGCAADRGDEEEDEDEGALSWIDEGCTGAPTDSQRCDQGLYWFGKGNTSEKWRPSRANKNFDPKKPTLIYVHGWQADGWKTASRETFSYRMNDPESAIEALTADAWIDKGWNVGLFYWNRLADDAGEGWFSSPDAAEAKIWKTDGPTGMRWRRNDGTFETVDVPTKPASELFFDVYASAMKHYRGPHVRIAGHSLGNQMATRMTFLASIAVDDKRLPEAAMPKRLALLDPYWTKQKSGSSRVGPSREIRDNVYMLARRGVAIEQYKSSSINDYGLGDDNPFVEENAAYTELNPSYFGFLASVLPWDTLRSDHRAAPNLYFWSFAFDPPSECNGKPGAGLSASASDETVRSFMGPGRYWQQGGGTKTPTPGDDCFVLKTDNRPRLQPVGLFWERAGQGALRVRIEAPPGVMSARYFVDGHKVGSATREANGLGFETTLTGLPVNAPETLIVASVYDERDQMLGTTEDMVDLVSDAGMYIRQFGGMTFEVGFDAPPAGLAKVELDVDGRGVVDTLSRQRRTERKAVRASYDFKDGLKRAFTLRGYDASGRKIVTLDRSFILR